MEKGKAVTQGCAIFLIYFNFMCNCLARQCLRRVEGTEAKLLIQHAADLETQILTVTDLLVSFSITASLVQHDPVLHLSRENCRPTVC